MQINQSKALKGRKKAAHIHAVFLKPCTTAETLKRNEVLTYMQINQSTDLQGREKEAYICAMFLTALYNC